MREVFEGTLTVRYITSSLSSCDAERTATKIGALLQRKDYDEVGVRKDGIVTGYARREDLKQGKVGDHLRAFAEDDIISADVPLLDALELVKVRGRVFISVFGEVNGIVTPGDVVKPPVRLWLFGLLTILEQQITRLIRGKYPNDSWTTVLSLKRVKQAENILAKRKQNHTTAELMDCLTLSDKQAIVANTPQLQQILGVQPGQQLTDLNENITALRNNLAHAHDISDQWPEFLEEARIVEDIIKRAEQVTSRELRG